MRKAFGLIALLMIIYVTLNAQQNKREFRASWISTVANIDWPKTPGSSTKVQKSQLIEILDYLKAANLNAVVFQIRPACDAMYASEIEPWSSWLTGQQGKAPSPFWDPLEFAVEEAHKRGMELHAWFNPYRVKLAGWTLQLDENNVAVKNPDWVLNIGGDMILDPGLPEVRNHVTNVIMDVVRRYDVDAIHFDDYFYLSGITNEDADTYSEYNRGFTNLGDWRRDNVNELLRMIYSEIQAEKPYVKFGQSPAGIWKNNVPAGIFGRDNYSAIYCDPVTWLSEGIIDYLAPQCYWAFDGGQDYGKLAPWWASVRSGKHIYPGLAFYRVGTSSFDKSQIGRMVQLNRQTEGLFGEVYFTAGDFYDNNGGVTDTLTNNYYKYKALIPPMEWKDQVAPSNPANLRFDRVAGLGTTALTWDKPEDDDLAWFAVYSFDNSSISAADLENPANIFDVTSKNYYPVDENFPSESKYYVVTALDKNHNESTMSNSFQFQPSLNLPASPILAYPGNGTEDLGDTITLGWSYAENAATYSLQIATDENFTNLFLNKNNIVDTSYMFTGMNGETQFFWRVTAENYIGVSDYSEVYNFTTGFPAAPALAYPAFQQLDVELNPVFKWSDREDKTGFTFVLYEGLSISKDKLVVEAATNQAEYASPELKPSTFYTWTVKVSNQLGASLWSDASKFKTLSILPDAPIIVGPVSGKSDVPDSVELKWQQASYAEEYNLQISYNSDYSSPFYNADHRDTSIVINDLTGETEYFWRVRSKNNSGNSDFVSGNFTTGFPGVIIPVYPADTELDIPISPQIRWSSSSVADQYNFQISQDVSFNMNKIVVDAQVTDTTIQLSDLELNTIYSWRVMASNSIGSSNWSDVYRFRTTQDTTTSVNDNELPVEFALHQNYPNPFNPNSTISFDLPEAGFVKLTVFNVLGEEVAVLVNKMLNAGTYKINFVAKNLNSGFYFYKINAGNYTSTKKMILMK